MKLARSTHPTGELKIPVWVPGSLGYMPSRALLLLPVISVLTPERGSGHPNPKGFRRIDCEVCSRQSVSMVGWG